MDNNGTGSTETGPSGDHTTGSGKYIYIEASTCYNKSAILKSNCIDLSRYSNANLSFWHHMYGANIGTLSVDIEANGVLSSNVFTISDDQGDVWSEASIDLAPYIGNSEVYIMIKAVTGASFRSDFALDDINLTGELAVDTNVTVVGDLLICQGDQTTLVAVSNSEYTYQWYKDASPIAGATGSSYSANESGAYYVAVTYQGTTKNSNERTLTVDICTGVKENKNMFTVYPNPATDQINVTSSELIQHVTILSTEGKALKSTTTTSLDVSDLSPGIYFISISIEGTTYQEKFVIE